VKVGPRGGVGGSQRQTPVFFHSWLDLKLIILSVPWFYISDAWGMVEV